ncbi:MAG: polyprenyl synthetase family protein [Nitrososphaerales archaeon]
MVALDEEVAAKIRRGTKSIVSKYGLSNAILASDLLLFNVPKMIAKYDDRLESSKLSKLFDLVGEACRAATWGEFLDLEMARRADNVSELQYEEMVRSKTASVLSAPSASGAIVALALGSLQLTVSSRLTHYERNYYRNNIQNSFLHYGQPFNTQPALTYFQ